MLMDYGLPNRRLVSCELKIFRGLQVLAILISRKTQPCLTVSGVISWSTEFHSRSELLMRN